MDPEEFIQLLCAVCLAASALLIWQVIANNKLRRANKILISKLEAKHQELLGMCDTAEKGWSKVKEVADTSETVLNAILKRHDRLMKFIGINLPHVASTYRKDMLDSGPDYDVQIAETDELITFTPKKLGS